MNYEFYHSAILGAVQGITEFLPISSSGHLIALPYLFNWKYDGLDFDIALHFGTVIALLFVFWRDWLIIINQGFRGLINRLDKNFNKSADPKSNYPENLLWQLVLATIPAAISGLIIEKYVESYFHSPILLAINFALFGLLLWIADKKSSNKLTIADLGYKRSFLIGLLQSIALIPGISRSGITIITGRAIGLDRESAARFSFLLAMPAMIGAFVLKAKDLAGDDLSMTLGIGVLFSTLFGILAIRFLLNFLKKSSFSIFAYYRLFLAIIILMFVVLRA